MQDCRHSQKCTCTGLILDFVNSYIIWILYHLLMIQSDKLHVRSPLHISIFLWSFPSQSELLPLPRIPPFVTLATAYCWLALYLAQLPQWAEIKWALLVGMMLTGTPFMHITAVLVYVSKGYPTYLRICVPSHAAVIGPLKTRDYYNHHDFTKSSKFLLCTRGMSITAG